MYMHYHIWFTNHPHSGWLQQEHTPFAAILCLSRICVCFPKSKVKLYCKALD
uniref:Uncharacterized protein n=1 Tax=Arundo donax TaxID=35708 RepID=A0A0A9C1E4_ARUDO